MAQNNITVTLTQLDAVGDSLARRLATFSDDAPTVGEFNAGYLVDTNEATIGLPIAQVRQFLLRNTHASGKITVKWTPTTGAQATVVILAPGDFICFWNQNTGATLGFSSLKLTADVSGTTYELFMGG